MTRGRSKYGPTEADKQAFLEECRWDGTRMKEMELLVEHVNFIGYDDEPEEKLEEEPEEEPNDSHEDDLVNCLKEDEDER